MRLVLSGREEEATEISLSGTNGEAARKLSFTCTRRVNAGETAELFIGTERVFLGIVLFSRYSDMDGVSTVQAFDFTIYLVKNRLFLSLYAAPKSIAASVAKELGIARYEVSGAAAKVKVVSVGDKSAYRVLREAFPEKRIYFAGDKLMITPPKVVRTIAESQIMACERLESAKDMVNRVLILKRKRLRGTAENAEDRMRFGTFTGVYTVPLSGVSRPKSALKTLTDELTIRIPGDIGCAAGERVRLSAFGKNAVYTIAEDRHLFDGGYVTELTLQA